MLEADFFFFGLRCAAALGTFTDGWAVSLPVALEVDVLEGVEGTFSFFFLGAPGDPAAAFKPITTTNTIVAGPKAQIDLAAPALAAFSPTLYYSDEVGAAVQGFGIAQAC